ncbi:ParA family protein [Kitasatospora sp. RB6PN24]|uniref:ParA family protein n=1 Tax=Kitasatospora humi TaxID=2893891 RepID=UPI001E48A7BF|nr:ParA family protein [Kitasatospora humi]MCC9309973.1 ParA family protein [Kitasatospora humi]
MAKINPGIIEVANERRIAASGQAGGAGKTQAMVNLAVELALRGYRVLVWDLDPQRSTSHIFGHQDPMPGQPTIFSVLCGENKLLEAVVPARYRIGEGDEDSAFRLIPGIDLVLGTPQMAEAEVTLGNDSSGVLWLDTVLDEQVPKGRWDVQLFDCGPTLGILLLSVALAVPEIIGCVNDEFKYVIGIQDLEATLAKGRRSRLKKFGFRAEMQHILATNIPISPTGEIDRSQGAVTDDVIEKINARADWQGKLLPIVRRSIRFKETIVRQKALRYHAPNNAALADIAAVADALGFPRLNSTRKKR